MTIRVDPHQASRLTAARAGQEQQRAGRRHRERSRDDTVDDGNRAPSGHHPLRIERLGVEPTAAVGVEELPGRRILRPDRAGHQEPGTVGGKIEHVGTRSTAAVAGTPGEQHAPAAGKRRERQHEQAPPGTVHHHPADRPSVAGDPTQSDVGIEIDNRSVIEPRGRRILRTGIGGERDRTTAIHRHLADPAVGGDIPDPTAVGREERRYRALGAIERHRIGLVTALPEEFETAANRVGEHDRRPVRRDRRLRSLVLDSRREERRQRVLPERDTLPAHRRRRRMAQPPRDGQRQQHEDRTEQHHRAPAPRR